MKKTTTRNTTTYRKRSTGELRRLLVAAMSTAAALLLAAGIVSAAPVVTVDDGMMELTSDNVDALLELRRLDDLRVIELNDGPKDRLVSEAHVQRLRNWVEDGGVLWVTHKGLKSGLATSLADFELQKYKYKKATTGSAGGELIVRDVKSNLKINDHPLTRNVQRLYIYPRWSFAGSDSTIPLVEMTDQRGEYGEVIAAIEMGRGYMVLDGTARDENFLFRRLPGFNENHPNAVQIGDEWKNYDWPQLRDNAVRLSDPDVHMSSFERYGR